MTEESDEVRAVRHEAPGIHTFPDAVYCRQAAPCCEVCEPCSVEEEHRICHDEECSHALFGHRRERAVEFLGISSLQELKLHSQRPGRDVQFSYEERLDRTVRVREDRHTADLGDGLLEQFQFFAEYFRADAVGHPVTFPPGRARLSMNPSPTGSALPEIMTMGIISVAFLAAATPCVPSATMMSTLSRTSSTARSGSRSDLPSVDR